MNFLTKYIKQQNNKLLIHENNYKQINYEFITKSSSFIKSYAEANYGRQVMSILYKL